MTKIAVITQGLRAHECVTYLNNSQNENERVIIICSSKAIFDHEVLPGNLEIREYKSLQKFRRNDIPLFITSKQRIKKYTRGGSDSGVRLERFLNSLIWKMRYIYRASELFFKLIIKIRRKAKENLSRHRNQKPSGYEALREELLTISDENQLDEILVFDLFDLPAVLDFVDDQAIEVKVR
tara:strand:- start:484 stop:1026 length:543 start_codon:yes stop_codon:yes gene_type:complete